MTPEDTAQQSADRDRLGWMFQIEHQPWSNKWVHDLYVRAFLAGWHAALVESIYNRGIAIRVNPTMMMNGQEQDWDGHSPINGQPVLHVLTIGDRRYAFTFSGMYQIKEKPAADGEDTNDKT